ncbi:hypothetical protein A9Q81_01035 [Gammaproteobacteria bacterium 42_54_T18]|nr:hypothetical protein A9Q81_01035 [Gammaproteobacteria bacterium 42_54_T18]
MKPRVVNIISWLIVLWTAKVFLSSLPYKFTGHPDTQHIFGTIGAWMKGILGDGAGNGFIQYGAYAVGTVELITTIILISPAVFWALKKTNVMSSIPSQHLIHSIGGIMASGVMTGAVFFHLFTPLGIEVMHEGKSDHGSLFYAAVSILVLGGGLFVMNFLTWKTSNGTEE